MSIPASCKPLMDMVDSSDLFEMPQEELLPAQLLAAQDLYDERRGQIRILEQRGNDEGVRRLEKVSDIVPLLFSHTTYKSYPESYIRKGKWDQLTRWFQTLSALPVEADMTGVENVDQWVDRMWDSGHYLYATSGTTGKCSFLDNSAADRAFVEHGINQYWGWPNPYSGTPRRRHYQFFMGEGPQAPMHWFKALRDSHGQSNAQFVLGQEPVRVSQLNRIGGMRKAMSDGTASPEDILAFQAEMKDREAKIRARLVEMTGDMIAHRHEPLYVNGWQSMADVLDLLRAEGVAEGDFSDVQFFGRARKALKSGNVTQADMEVNAMRYFNQPSCFGVYGMTELSLPMPECEAGNYHRLPWIMILVLDQNGNALVEPTDGVAHGRGAFLDLSREARWGGVITSDKIQVDYTSRCTCGRPGPVVLDTISRIGDSGEDKVDCAGTFDSYIRGVIAEEVA